MSLSDKQRGVLKGMVVGASITAAVLTTSTFFGPELLEAKATTSERITFAMKVDIVIALWLGFSIGWLARYRFFSPDDIDGGGLTRGTSNVNVYQATLQNTLEQTVLATMAHVAWAAAMPTAWIATIPAAVILFLLGRILFVRGYANGAASRALGFALTFYPSMLMLIFVLMAIIWNAVL